MKIEVTQDDIEKGKPRLADSCPVALAMRRALNRDVWVTCLRYWFDSYDNPEQRFESHDVCQFVFDFDYGLPVKPFSFELEVPNE